MSSFRLALERLVEKIWYIGYRSNNAFILYHATIWMLDLAPTCHGGLSID